MTPRPQDLDPTPRAQGATVVVVDQVPEARAFLRGILQDAGHHVEEAVDGASALRLVERTLPDVVVMDAASCLEGLAMWMRRLKGNMTTRDTPVLLIVPAGDQWNPHLEPCVDECIEKPAAERELLRRVRSMTRLRQLRHELVQSRSLRGEQTRIWGVLLEFAQSVDKITDLDELFGQIVATATEMTSSRRVSLMLPDEDEQYLTIVKAIGLDEEIVRNVKVPLGGAVSGHAFASGRPVTTLEQTPSAPRQGYDFKAFVSMPMIYSKLSSVHQRVGVLNISNRYGDRPFEEWELEFIDLLGSIAGSAIDEIHSRRTRESLIRIERDLQLARQIQQNTFPTRLPDLAGFEIEAWTEPAEETGGDTYDVIGYTRAAGGQSVQLSAERAERALLMLADATGHGIGPALSVTQVRAMLRMAVRMEPDLGRIARHLNEQLCADLPEGRFITAWFGELDASNCTITSFSAGQGPILRYDAARDAFDLLQADAMPLGISPTLDITIGDPICMNPGDILAVISDGVFEAFDPQGVQFGTERAIAVIAEHRQESPKQILAALREGVAAFTSGAPADDDRTVIIVKAS